MVAIGARRPDVVAITAAMLHPVGLAPFKAAYPDRVYDVGIAEQHAMTMAAGLAMAGMHPVVSIYATFLNRAFDQLLMDVALHKLPVTVTLDRAGVTGPDGASHNGMWDGSILQVVPGLRVAAPRDGSRIAELLNEAIEVTDGPTVVRWPKGNVGAEAEAVGKLGQMDVLAVPGPGLGRDVLLLGAGPMAVTAVEVAGRLADHGIGVTVVDPRWVKPVDEAVVAEARNHRLVAVAEDNGRVGGFGDAVARLLRDHDVDVPVKTFGLAQEFLDHASRDSILEAAGLTPQHLARQLTDAVARRSPGFTGADLANVINEAALLTARNEKRAITNEFLEEAIDRVIAGPERRTRAMSEHEKKITAYHEGGHALVAWALPHSAPVHKVTILPRGRSLGHTLVLPTEDKYTQTRAELVDTLAYALGGRAAEELVFHEPTTGAQNDIEKATSIARAMVTEYGMSSKLGAVKYGQSENEPFLGRTMGHQRDYSDVIATEIDTEVRSLIELAHDEAWEILVEYRDVLDNIVLELIDKETITQGDMARLCARVVKRPPMAPYNGFGKRQPSDQPPVLTPTEKDALKAQAEADGMQALSGGPLPGQDGQR